MKTQENDSIVFLKTIEGWLTEENFINNIIYKNIRFLISKTTTNETYYGQKIGLKKTIREMLIGSLLDYCDIHLKLNIFRKIWTGPQGFQSLTDKYNKYFDINLLNPIYDKIIANEIFINEILPNIGFKIEDVIQPKIDVVDINYIDEPEDLVGNKFKLLISGEEIIITVTQVDVENDELEISFIISDDIPQEIIMSIDEFEFLKENDSVDLTIGLTDDSEEITFSFID